MGSILRAGRDGPNRFCVLYLCAGYHGRSTPVANRAARAERGRAASVVVVVARSTRGSAATAPELATEPVRVEWRV